MKPCHRLEVGDIPEKGIYVFYENGRPIYVGRSNRLKDRIQEHGRPGSKNNSAPFAFNIAKSKAKRLGINIDKARSKLEKVPEFKEEFKKAKGRVARMHVRVLEVENQITQHVFEVYAAFHLETTKYNYFGTH